MSTADGLSHSRVGQIIQDDRGFIWFGTSYGLDRFDGHGFTVFVHERDRPGSLGGEQITALFKDHKGTLWAGCNHALERFNPADETFTHYRLTPDGQIDTAITVFNISEDNGGMLWLSTRKGMYRFDPETKHVTHFTHDPKAPQSIGSDEVISTGQDRSGVFWVGHGRGLDRFDRSTGKVTMRIPLDQSRLLFHEDRFGVFWLTYGADRTLATLDRQTGRLTRYPIRGDALSDAGLDWVMGMFEDRDGTMWFATRRNGLLKYDRSGRRFIRYRHYREDDKSIAADRVTTIYQDREGNFWVGLDEAPPNFFVSRPPLFENLTPLTQADGAADRRTVIYEDRERMLWIGSERALWKVPRDSQQRAESDANLSSVVSIAEQGPNTVWLAGNVKGLVRLDRTTGRRKIYAPLPNTPGGLNTNQIERVVVGRDGTPWLATWDGLVKVDAASERFTIYRNKHGSGYHSIAEDKTGVLWLASDQGLQRFDPSTGAFADWENDPADAHTLSDNRVNNIFFDHAGILWIATDNGLDRFDQTNGKFVSYFERDGLASNLVSCILEDESHFLWMSTNRGVSRLDPERKVFSSYGVEDGLPGADLTGWGTCAKAADGEMFFSGYSGAVAVRPRKVPPPDDAPQISLTGLELFGVPVRLGAGSPLKQSILFAPTLKLRYWQNFFSFEFAALSFANPSTIRYRYRMQGLDLTWFQTSGERRIASYTSVPAGHYTFQVQGASSHGSWSSPGVAIQVDVLPPWWMTLWFKTASIIAGLLGIVFLYRARMHQIARSLTLRFEERISERTRIARDLHDTLLQSFQGALFEFQGAQKLMSNRPEEARLALDRAIHSARAAVAEGRDAIQGLRLESRDPEGLADLLRALGKECLDADTPMEDSTTFHVTVEGPPEPLMPALQDELFRISQELLRNAFRHAYAKQIEVEIRYSPHELRVRIRDDGIGIDSKVLNAGARPGHWGLPGVRERAKLIGAEVDLWSQAAAGTEIQIRVAASLAYLKSRSFDRLRLLRKGTRLYGG